MITWDLSNSYASILSNDSLTVTTTGVSHSKIRATEGKSSGKWYWEIVINTIGTVLIGIADASLPANSSTDIISTSNVNLNRTYGHAGRRFPGNYIYGGSIANNDVISVLLDADNYSLSFWKNGVDLGVAFADFNTFTTIFPFIATRNNIVHEVTANFGASTFKYNPPIGYSAYEPQPINKTLILHNGEYKNYKEGKLIYSSLNAIPQMTSNTSPSGIASASNIYSTSYDAWKAFDRVDDVSVWATTSGVPTGWIRYEFNQAKQIGKYSLKQASVWSATTMPMNWTFEGSNDGSTWTILDTRDNVKDWGMGEKRTFEFYNDKFFKIYRLNISRNVSNLEYIVIQEIEMFEVTGKEDSGFKVVTNALPTPTQFIENGMDSLTPLLDRKVKTLEPQAMDSKIGILPVESTAKVFSKKLDLNKYMDVRKIEVK